MVNHPNRKRTYPDQTLEKALRASGVRVVVLWEIKGPKDTSVDWMVGYQAGSWPVIVQTYTDGNGWNAFTPARTIDVDKTIADVFARCGIREPETV